MLRRDHKRLEKPRLPKFTERILERLGRLASVISNGRTTRKWIRPGRLTTEYDHSIASSFYTHAKFKIFRKVERQLPLLTTFDLQFVSPQLLKAENLELAVPGICRVYSSGDPTDLSSGTYRSGKPVICITRFFPRLSVFASKQRPRRLSIMGSNGVEYQFLLKGWYRGSIPSLS
jgi:phosphatidylinositol kinase/protein kinase (PI-3  family)